MTHKLSLNNAHSTLQTWYPSKYCSNNQTRSMLKFEYSLDRTMWF